MKLPNLLEAAFSAVSSCNGMLLADLAASILIGAGFYRVATDK